MNESIRSAGAGLVLAAIVLAGCASTSLTGQWQSPGFSGSPLTRLEAVGMRSLVFNPSGSRPANGDFLGVMQQNIENLAAAYQ